MDPANPEAFLASKLDWNDLSEHQQAVERLFAKVAKARQIACVKNENPQDTQYKAWDENEHVFLLRRREPAGSEFLAFFNLASDAVKINLSAAAIDAIGCGAPYLITLHDDECENEWPCTGRYTLWLDTNEQEYGGLGSFIERAFEIADASQSFQLQGMTALVFSKRPTGTWQSSK
jgi:hypothetical protein